MLAGYVERLITIRRLSGNKYGARKRKVDGHLFDSQAEANFYIYLKNEKKEGRVKEFILQPKYELMAGFDHPEKKTKAGKPSKVRPIDYIADFEITDQDGKKMVVDVKGYQTPVFRIKAKLFMQKFNMPLYLVRQKGKGFKIEVF